jgi:hypothetical protein
MTDPGVKKAPDPGSAILPTGKKKKVASLNCWKQKLFLKSRWLHTELESPNGGFYRSLGMNI